MKLKVNHSFKILNQKLKYGLYFKEKFKLHFKSNILIEFKIQNFNSIPK